MSDIDKVLDRLRVDADYQVALISDPIEALAPYELTSDDLRRLDRALGRQMEPSIRSLLNRMQHPNQADPAVTMKE